MQPKSSASCCGGCQPEGVVIDTASQTEPLTGGVRLYINAMDCPTEERMIRAKLESMPEVKSLAFNLMDRVLTVQPATSGGMKAITRALDEIGFSPKVLDDDQPPPAGPSPSLFQDYGRLALGGLCALVAETLHFQATDYEWLIVTFALLAIALSGLTTYKKGWIALRHLDFNINALMSIAVTGAMLIGEWPEAAMVMVLFTLAEVIESKSLDRARNAIKELMALAPDTATVKDLAGNWMVRPVAEVELGQTVRVRPGEKIPLDGVIIMGAAAVNQAPITGESLPVEKTVGDKVFAGTLNETGVLELQVTALASDSTVARIIQAVEKAQSERAPAQRFIDRFARIYTPAVLVLAVFTALLMPLAFGWSGFDAVYRALVLLVIACPCALVISTPVTVVSGLAAAARHGVLVKGGLYLELASKLKALAFDKTGTLTEGRPQVTHVELIGNARHFDAVLYAASLAHHSNHPISQAVVRFADEREQLNNVLSVDGFESLTGRGVKGRLRGLDCVLGNHRLIHELGLCSNPLETALEAIEEQGQTAVVLVCNQRPWAIFAIADQPKAQSRMALDQLRELNIHTLVLSGDNPHTVASIAEQLGVDDARGNLLPEQKLEVVQALKAKHGITAMVGDGINDAPAMASADIGFAMGAAGTDTAIETADVALMDDNLEKLPWFIRLSRTASWRLKQNIALALSIKLVFIVLALMGEAPLWMAVFADMGASLLVVFNGLRLLRFK